jgi:hypothetical protein
MFTSASAWALKRLLKVALKPFLKRLLATELDVEQLQLRVNGGTAAFELCEVLLNPDWLAEHTVRSAFAEMHATLPVFPRAGPQTAQLLLCQVLMALLSCLL